MLKNGRSIADLLVGSEHQFRWSWGLKKAMARIKRFSKSTAGFWFDGVLTLVSRENILCIRGESVVAQLQRADADGYEVLYDLYAQVYPEYSGLERQIEYSE